MFNNKVGSMKNGIYIFVDEGLYDWAIENDFFKVKNEHQKEAKFIQQFTCASIEHFHFENGERG
ncbi:hypothetical protein EDF65_2095 [Chryseobacterium nakagawai]|nr:hypothetical protein EDF65_2095 [Chryseobacterium nakagawai]